MATTVPLNFFRSVKIQAETTNKVIYTTPMDTAGIIISLMATNLTPTPKTITASISTLGSPLHTFVKDFEIPPNDAVNLVINKFVITAQDRLSVYANVNNSVNVTLAVLESINVP